jgi:hypothetical protein
MKSKDRVTLMVYSFAAGAKLPLFMVGAAKQPLCFNYLCCNGQPHALYASSKCLVHTRDHDSLDK